MLFLSVPLSLLFPGFRLQFHYRCLTSLSQCVSIPLLNADRKGKRGKEKRKKQAIWNADNTCIGVPGVFDYISCSKGIYVA